MPTSMTVAPGLTCSGPMSPRTPVATTTMSAGRVTAARSAVNSWATVTVAPRRSSSWASGRPTSSPQPTTATCAPVQLDALGVEQFDDAAGRAGAQAAFPAGEQAGAGGGETVDVLGDGDAVDQRARRRGAAGRGSCSRMPETSGSAASSSMTAATSCLGGVAGAGGGGSRACRPRGWRGVWRRRTRRWPDRRRRGWSPGRAPVRRQLAGDLARRPGPGSAGRSPLPSIVRGHGGEPLSARRTIRPVARTACGPRRPRLCWPRCTAPETEARARAHQSGPSAVSVAPVACPVHDKTTCPCSGRFACRAMDA